MTGQPFEQTLGLSKLLGRLHLFREFVVRRSSIGVLSERWGIFDAQPNTEKQKQPKKPGAGTLTQRHKCLVTAMRGLIWQKHAGQPNQAFSNETCILLFDARRFVTRENLASLFCSSVVPKL